MNALFLVAVVIVTQPVPVQPEQSTRSAIPAEQVEVSFAELDELTKDYKAHEATVNLNDQLLVGRIELPLSSQREFIDRRYRLPRSIAGLTFFRTF